MEEVYTNQGKGLVLGSKAGVAKVLELFQQKTEWTSAELDEQVGWQFSQYVFRARSKYKLNIFTIRTGPKQFKYVLKPGEFVRVRKFVSWRTVYAALSADEVAKLEAYILNKELEKQMKASSHD